jgi:hypothetical protein
MLRIIKIIILKVQVFFIPLFWGFTSFSPVTIGWQILAEQLEKLWSFLHVLDLFNDCFFCNDFYHQVK